MNYTRLCTLSARVPISSLSCRVLSTTSEFKVKGTQEFFHKNDVLKRPMSPHLTIYKPQLTSMLSIAHRVSGAGYGVLLYAGAVLTLCPGGFSSYVALAESYAPGMGLMLAMKSVVLLPFVYHTINGFRHLAWDSGKGFGIADVYKTGKIVAAISIVVTLLIAALV